MSNEQHMANLRNKLVQLNKVSPSMCLAKWLQTTTTLYNGFTHSCHHPSPHKINVEDIKLNPRGLHNTPIKIYARDEMLDGIQTKECDYCWRIENMSPDNLSDRTYKSATSWAWPHLQKVLDSGVGEDINPTYFEVAFENTCNFKCVYCSPEVSSRWMEEVKQHGTYQLTNKKMHDVQWMTEQKRIPIHYKEENPYIDAFWKWWPDLYPELETFRITGGEPLLSKHTWKVLDYILEHPRKDLTLAINTNMGVPPALVTKLIEYCNRLAPLIKEVQIFTSAEATGEQCEYIRSGMVWSEFEENCNAFLTHVNPDVRLSFMVTANMLGATTFGKFIEWIVALRTKFNTTEAINRVPMMISYLRWPDHLSMVNLPPELKLRYSSEWATITDSLKSGVPGRVYLEEIDQIQRLTNFMNSSSSNNVQTQDFYLFQSETDRRRGTDVCATFPELADYYAQGKQLTGVA